jgi:predicted nucleotidyltransferase
MRTSQSGQSALLLLDAVEVLKELKIEYAVIGAMAASFHGAVRASLDADVVFSLTTQSLQILEERFKKDGFATELRKGDFDDPIPAVLALNDSFGNRVDLLAGIRGMDLDAFQRTVSISFHGQPLCMVGLEDFVAMKLFAGSPTDLNDARHAFSASKSRVNRPLLQKLVSRYGAETVERAKTLF